MPHRGESFEKLVLPHMKAGYNLARWLLRNDHDAEDITQEAIVRAFRFFDGFSCDNPRAWLLTVVRNSAYTFLQQNRARELGTEFNEEIHSEPAAKGRVAETPEVLVMRSAEQRHLNQAVESLPVEFREVFVLRDAQTARLFALLDLALADSVIAFYDAKYTYNLWRPVTAIRAADTDGNPDTVADPNWLPLVGKTAPDPSYPGAHAVISAAAARVLAASLEDERSHFSVTSEVMPGVERSFDSLADAAREATLSRIFAGQHFRFDLTAGERLGRQVAEVVLDGLLTPRNGKDHDR